MGPIEHDSFSEGYRDPGGALVCGATVLLRLRVQNPRPQDQVRLWTAPDGEPFVSRPMEEEERGAGGAVFRYALQVPERPGLVWYYFSLEREGQRWFCGRRSPGQSGPGVVRAEVPPAWQITVYRGEAASPRWFRESVAYQIFVDRFCNGTPDGRALSPRRNTLLHATWDSDPFYIRDPDTGGIRRWDFFGGNLEGVRRKLPYLAGLGIRCLYLNPIFEASSNHKYDTGDYHRIDPMFGDEEAFRRLCREAQATGISVILDGVFSHTGSDSRYFNRYGTYDSVGAWQSPDSPYSSWYTFTRYPQEYSCWWGDPSLPNVNELEESYQDFIARAPDSVIRHWMEAGARGWRLDVADELPDAFIRTLREETRRCDPESVLIGEVWEDASNKISYGKRRGYFSGDQLDSVMNYPLRGAILGYLRGELPADQLEGILRTLAEHTPRFAWYSQFNILGSHDTRRLSDELDADPRRIRAAQLFQMTFPGVPCVYYGDEAGVPGGTDPDNRRPFPWGSGDRERTAWVRDLAGLRNRHAVLTGGSWHPWSDGEDLFGYVRAVRGGRDAFGEPAGDNVAVVCLHAGTRAARTVRIPVGGWVPDGTFLHDVFSEYRPVPVRDGALELVLEPLEGKLLLQHRFPGEVRTVREAGVLLHPTSLPSGPGMGGLGRGFRECADWLSRAGQRVWQILPFHPTDESFSPYQGLSAFAGDPLWIDLQELVRQGYLPPGTLEEEAVPPGGRVDPAWVRTHRMPRLQEACQRFWGPEGEGKRAACDAFFRAEAGWLDDYALFQALREHHGGIPWTRWDPGAARRDPGALARWRDLLGSEIRFHRTLQFWFFSQWDAARAGIRERGIRLLGDLPFYVHHDSADVWSHPELFDLDGTGAPRAVAGVPPDYFSTSGQVWGHPLYRWEAHRSQGYAWWIARIRFLARWVDWIRLDHFRAFADYWAVPAGQEHAGAGEWRRGPGRSFFDALREAGAPEILAENLGDLSPEARVLWEETGYPGMQLWQFLPEGSPEQVAALRQRRDVLYTGTHDNDTLRGWLEEQGGGWDPREHQEIIRRLYASEADTVILPMQDCLALGTEARMNTPGTADGNWRWRLTGWPSLERTREIRDLIDMYCRNGGQK